jgi:hypothetical protein
LGLAALLGLALVVWLFTTLWIVAVGAGLVGGLIGLWRRGLSRYSFGPRRWRKVTRGSLEAVKPHTKDRLRSKDRF